MIQPYLCFSGIEIANGDRITTYLNNGLGITNASAGCDPCEALLDDGEFYSYPWEDGAPWFDDAVEMSREFLGILPQRITVLSSIGRTVQPVASGGGVLSSNMGKPRVLSFSGLMFASGSDGGMEYGERWLNEVLAGSRCIESCLGDEVTYLPFCPPLDYGTPDRAFRRLIAAGVTDGPLTAPLKTFPEAKVQQVTFQIVSSSPYIFGLEEPCMEDVVVDDDPVCCRMDAPDWSYAVPVITIAAEGGPGTNITVTGSPTFDDGEGDFPCPASGGMDCWSITIPALPQDGRIIIDGTRQQVRYYDPSLKLERSGIRLITFEGPLTFPEVAPCSNFCICAHKENNPLDGDVTISVDKVIREL